MATRKIPAAQPQEPGNGDRFWIDGREIALTKDDKDFVLMGASPKLEALRRSEPTGPLLDLSRVSQRERS